MGEAIFEWMFCIYLFLKQDLFFIGKYLSGVIWLCFFFFFFCILIKHQLYRDPCIRGFDLNAAKIGLPIISNELATQAR